MKTQHRVLFLFFLYPFVYARQDCPSLVMCSNTTVRFPFQLLDQEPQTCGYPGFNLTCNSQSTTGLTLPKSGEFLVRNINYITQSIQLYDPENCLAKRLLNLSLSGSPFRAIAYENYTFLSCPVSVTTSKFKTIGCLSNSTNSILATSSMTVAKGMLNSSCSIMFTLLIPVSPRVDNEDGFFSDLSDDLQLIWDVPQCGACESASGMCGFNGDTGLGIGCVDAPPTGKSSRSLNVFRIISLSITVPAIACSIGIAIYTCSMDRRRRTRSSTTTQDASAIAPQPTITMTGLEDEVIESYTKLVVGESRRLPGPNDGSCSICLSEYHTKDTVRCIPECKHCFHAGCIDEWLRMNGSCPMCRNSPSPARVN